MAKRAPLSVLRSSDFLTKSDLEKLTGLSDYRFGEAVIKEIFDNGLDSLDEKLGGPKEVEIEIDVDHIAVYDTGPGMSSEEIQKALDFENYRSSKKLYRVPTRGYFGNALKIVFGICHVSKLEMYFALCDGTQIIHRLGNNVLSPNASPRTDGRTTFGIIIRGDISKIFIDEHTVEEKLYAYRLCNPHVTFSMNQTRFPAAAKTGRVSVDKPSAHWHTITSFNALAEAYDKEIPGVTTKEFCKVFSHAKPMLPNLIAPEKLKALFPPQRAKTAPNAKETKRRRIK